MRRLSCLLALGPLIGLASCGDVDCPDGTMLNPKGTRCIALDAGADSSVSDAGPTPRDGAADGSIDASVEPDGGACGELSPCGGDCVDLTSDESNCGECGHACSGTDVCFEGACADPAVEVSAAERHTCARTASGRMFCWGRTGPGALGTTEDSNVPLEVPGVGPVSWIAAGAQYSCALEGEGLLCWGLNNLGQLGDGTTTSRASPESVVGLGGRPEQVSASLNGAHSCALRVDGRARCWGLNTFGQLGDYSTTTRSEPVDVGGLGTAAQVVTGGMHSCARLSSGSVYCWGFNNAGQLGNGTTTDEDSPVAVSSLPDAVALDAGAGHTCAVRSTGTVACWGNNASGELGDGTVVSADEPVAVFELSDAQTVSTGGAHTCALTDPGDVYCWGYNEFGQLGDGTADDRLVPTPVDLPVPAMAVAAGAQHTCAITVDGRLYCWGLNGVGQLGDGTEMNSTVPRWVAEFPVR